MRGVFVVATCVYALFHLPPDWNFMGLVLALPVVGFFGVLLASALFLVLMVPLTLVEVIWDSVKSG